MENQVFERIALDAACAISMARAMSHISATLSDEHRSRALALTRQLAFFGVHNSVAFNLIESDAELRRHFSVGLAAAQFSRCEYGPLYPASVWISGISLTFTAEGGYDRYYVEQTLSEIPLAYGRSRRQAARVDALVHSGASMEQVIAACEPLMLSLQSDALSHPRTFGRLEARSLFILDQFDRELQRLSCSGWIEPLPAVHWSSAKADADRLLADAVKALQAGDVSQSDMLSDQVNALQQRLRVSERLSRVVDRASCAWSPLH